MKIYEGKYSERPLEQYIDKAHQLENRLANILQKAVAEGKQTVTTTQHLGQFSDYDIAITDEHQNIISSYELKEDLKASQGSANVAIEYSRELSTGRKIDTCVSVTKADWWVQYYNNTFHFIKVSTLKKLIADKKFIRDNVSGGAGERSRMYLFTKKLFEENISGKL